MSIYNWVKKFKLNRGISDQVSEAYIFFTSSLESWKITYRVVTLNEKIGLQIDVGDGPDHGKMQILEMIVNQTEMRLPKEVSIFLGEDAILPRDTGDYFMEVELKLNEKDSWTEIHG